MGRGMLAFFVAASGLIIGGQFIANPVLATSPQMHQHPIERGTIENPLNIVRDPTDLTPPLNRSGPTNVSVELQTVEVFGKLADGATYHYWTFNGKVPGPFLRVRVGDVVEVKLKNAADSAEKHSVDLHAVTGPGGGGVATQAAPGETKSFTFRALNPGLYVYHCATPPAVEHIAAGMYGLILVEPQDGLPKVDREFYVMQGEIYTDEPFGAKGKLGMSREKIQKEQPEYFVFNGAVGALSMDSPLKAYVGETIRIFFGVGGPNYTSSLHVIGETFDKVYEFASLTKEPLTGMQSTIVPAGGATVVDIKVEVPGDYLLVDHALSRAARGPVGTLHVEYRANSDEFTTQNAAP